MVSIRPKKVVAMTITVFVLIMAGITLFQDSQYVVNLSSVIAGFTVFRAAGSSSSRSVELQSMQQQQQQQHPLIPDEDDAATILHGYNESSDPSRNKQPQSEYDFDLKEYRLCRIIPHPQQGKPPIVLPQVPLPLSYQCAGPDYDKFAEELENAIHQESQRKNPNWGKRKTIIPTTASPQERAILIMGNSHTRQLVSELVCQYNDQIVRYETLYDEFAATTTTSSKKNHSNPTSKHEPQRRPSLNAAVRIQFQDNLQVYTVINCPFVYSHQWGTILEDYILQRPLHSFDAIVLGRFNGPSESSQTSFYDTMMNYQHHPPQQPQEGHPHTIDFESIPGPTVKDVAAVYPGPIVWVGMFSKSGVQYHTQALQEIEQVMQNHTSNSVRLHAIDARYYIEKLKHTNSTQLISLHKAVDECASDNRQKVGTCQTNPSHPRYDAGHRCIGARGGHPDLIAWDLVEVLHQELP
jgi:hypothetical protein